MNLEYVVKYRSRSIVSSSNLVNNSTGTDYRTWMLVVDDDDVELNVLGCRVDILGTNCDLCVSMLQCCFPSTETIRLIRTGSPGRPPRLSQKLLSSDVSC